MFIKFLILQLPQCTEDEICKEITDMPGEFLVNPICQCPGQMSCPSVAPKNVEVMVYDKKVCCMIIEYIQGYPWQSVIISTKFWIRSSEFKSCLMASRRSQGYIHTVILPDWALKKWGLSNFAFQSFQGFIGTQNKKNSLIPVRDSWWPIIQILSQAPFKGIKVDKWDYFKNPSHE